MLYYAIFCGELGCGGESTIAISTTSEKALVPITLEHWDLIVKTLPAKRVVYTEESIINA